MTHTVSPELEHAPITRRARMHAIAARAWPLATTVGVSFGVVALQLAQGVLLARLLGPEGRGEYAASALYSQMLLFIGLFGAIEVVCRYAANETTSRQSLHRAAIRLSLITSGITAAIVILLNTVALPAEKQYLWPTSVLCALSVIGQQMLLIVTAIDRGAGKFTRYNGLRLYAAAVFPVLLFAWSLIGESTVWSTCWLLLVASLMSIVPSVMSHGLPQGGTAPSPEARELFKEGRPYALSMFATDLLERLDLLLVLWLAPIVTQGYYSAMIPVAYPLTVIPNTLGLFLFNAGAKSGSTLSKKQIHQILCSSIAIQTISTILFILLVGMVVEFFYGKEFAVAIPYAIWLAPIAAIKGIVQGLESYVKGRGYPMAAVRIRAIATVAMLALIAATYSSSGIFAILYGSLASQVVCLVGLAYIIYQDVASLSRSATASS